jgi:succinoglycan biosynthesis protein ExoA
MQDLIAMGGDAECRESTLAGVPGPVASVLVPVLDEAASLERALRTIRAQHVEGGLEILAIDGGSTDGSRELLLRAAGQDERICVLDNPSRSVPSALNRGLRAARGAYVVRMDAHTLYPPDYVARGVARVRRGDVASASGPALARGDGRGSRAVALALASPLGVGAARFRRALTHEEEVDTGFCGVWRRDLLVQVGGWDEASVVNEDAELAARIRARGGRIACLPEMAAEYVPRSSVRALVRQYWRYGQYRARTARLHPESMRRSHVLPPGVAALAAVAAVPSRSARPARRAIALYAAALVAEGARIARLERSTNLAWRVPLVFASMHLAWGAGFLVGMRRFGVPWAALRRTVAGPLRRTTCSSSRRHGR